MNSQPRKVMVTVTGLDGPTREKVMHEFVGGGELQTDSQRIDQCIDLGQAAVWFLLVFGERLFNKMLDRIDALGGKHLSEEYDE